MFFHSQTEVEQRHILNALQFELGKVASQDVRERMLFLLAQIDETIASEVASGLGLSVPEMLAAPLNQNVGADADAAPLQPRKFKGKPFDSPALSMHKRTKPGMETAQVAALVADGFDEAGLDAVKSAVMGAGGKLKLVGLRGGSVKGSGGKSLPVDFSLNTVASVLFDAVYVAGGTACAEALGETLMPLILSKRLSDTARRLRQPAREWSSSRAPGSAQRWRNMIGRFWWVTTRRRRGSPGSL